MRNYGLGSLWGIPTGATPTPMRFAVLKDVSLDIGGDGDALRGEKMFAIDYAKKNGKVGGKIGLAEFNMDALSVIIPGVTKTATAQVKTLVEELGTVPAPSGPYTITVANSATWVADLGVINGVTGLKMNRGATASGTGIYAVAAGVYTFNSADASTAVRISYTYSATSGSTYTIDNSVMTVGVPFQMILGNSVTAGRNFTVKLPQVYIPKIGFGLKSEGWAEFGLDYEATADANGKVGYIYTDDV